LSKLKIETLRDPCSTVSFYRARLANHEGTLGMGADIIEINPDYPGKRQ